MKNKEKILFLSLIAVFSASCGSSPIISSQSSSSVESTSSKESTSSLTPTSSSSSESSSLSSSSSASSSSIPVGTTFDFYAVNDFHGSVNENDNYYYEGGISKIFGKLHSLKQKRPDNSFVFSVGDMWQGSFQSNDNLGALITEAQCRDFDAGCLGNHDFDFGLETLETNIKNSSFPLLAGNIYKWNKGLHNVHWKTTAASTIIERGGLKLGVVGMIGEGQTTSIVSDIVDELYFANPEEDAINESQYLKEQGCQAVILLLHDTSSSIIGNKGWGCKKSLKTYFDGVFCGHNHTVEDNMDSQKEVPLLEYACNGEGIASFTLKWDGSKIVFDSKNMIEALDSWPEDQEINEIIDKYTGSPEFQTKANEVIGKTSGNLSSKSHIPNICTKSIYEGIKNDYSDIAVVMINTQRSPIYKGDITYSDFYKAAPFSNKIYILNSLGSEIKKEARYNCTYTGDLSQYSTLQDNVKYNVAVVDYIGIHKNEKKEFDYFPGLNKGTTTVVDIVNNIPVNFAASYLKTFKNAFSPDSFIGESNGFDLY